VRKELFLMLKEEKWDEMIKLLSRRRIFAQLGLPFPKNYKALNALKVCLRKHAMPVQSPELSKLLALTAHATQRELRRFGKRCGLRNNEVSLLQNVHRRKKSILAELSRSRSANSRIYELLEGISDEGLLYLFSVSSPRSARRISHYRIKLKSTRIRITGDDLKRLGIPQGPQFSKILRKILVLRLDGKLKSKKDELSFARKFAKD
jgi:tRNA nucleotidyltransferase/poly(A) polymerase